MIKVGASIISLSGPSISAMPANANKMDGKIKNFKAYYDTSALQTVMASNGTKF